MSPGARVAVIGLGTSVVLLDTALNIGFPAITRSFALAIGDIQWVVISYVLTYTSLMLVFGRIGDMFGHAAVFRIGLAWSVIALLACALAPNFTVLLVCRVLQGIGAALILSCGAALVTGCYDEARRSRVLGIYVMMMALANMFGPWLGGALVQLADWPAVFWFRVPVAALALILSYDLPTAPRSARAAFDVAGASLLALGLALILLALNHLRDWLGVPLGLAGLAAFVGFVRQEMRCARPMLDLAVFRLPGFALLNIASVLTNLGAFSVWLLVPYFLVHTGALSLSESGALLASAAAGTAVASPLGGRLIGKIAAERLALAGAVLVGSGLALIARWEQDTSLVALIAALGVQGVGLGLFQLAYTDIVAARLPRENRGVAGSLAMVTRTLGTVGAATLVLLAFQGLEPSLGFFGAFRRVFALAALVPFAMAGLLVLVSRAR